MTRTLVRFYLFRGLGLTWLYVPFQWFYLRNQGLSATELMVLNTVFCVAAVLLEVPTGALADRLGRRVALTIGAFSSTLACMAFLLLSGSLVGLAVANVLAALAMTCISGADSAYLYDFLTFHGQAERYGRAEALSTAAKLAATAVGAAVASALVFRGASLSVLYATTACLTAVAGVVALGLPEPMRDRPAAGQRGPALAEIIVHARRAAKVAIGKRELCVLLGLSAVLFPVLRVGLFLDQPYLDRLGYATAVVGLVFAAKDLVAASAAAFTARLLGLLGEFRLFAALPLVAGVALAFMAMADGRPAALLVLVPTAAFGIYSPLVRVFVNRRIDDGRDRATVLSIEGMARRLGFAAFSPLVGAAIDFWSLQTALTTSAAWSVAAVAVAAFLAFSGRRGPTSRVVGPAPAPPP